MLRIVRTPRRLAAGFRLVGCVVALTAVLGQIGTYAHLAFIAHVRCAEHGELIEAGISASVGAAHERTGERSYIADDGDVGHGHDHCVVAPHRRDTAAHAVARTLVATAQLPFIVRRVESVGPPHAIDLILLAPKNSPPA